MTGSGDKANGGTLAEHQKALVAARVWAQELQNLTVAGRLIDREAVELAIGDIVARVRMALLAFPGKHAATFATALGVPVENMLPLLRNAITDTLQTLAKQETEQADRVGRAVQAGVELGLIYGVDRQYSNSAEDERRGSRARARAGTEGGSEDGRQAQLDFDAGNSRTDRAAEPVRGYGKLARRRGRPLGSTT